MWPWLVSGNATGGEVIPLAMETSRPFRSDLTEENGVGANDGGSMAVMSTNGSFVTDVHRAQRVVRWRSRIPRPLDWKCESIVWYCHHLFEGVMQGYGLDRVEVHRFQWNTVGR